MLHALLAGAVFAAAAAPEPQTLSVEDLRRFASVFREVQNSFVEPVSDQALMQAAIRGLLSSLDPHSAYLAKADLESFSDDAAGNYGGLGLEVQVREGALQIVSPIDESPAARAGLKPGDVITRIDGKVLDGAHVYDGVEMLRGAPGSEIELTVQRASDAPFAVKLKRELIQIKSVRSETLPGGLGLVRISAFQTDTVNSTEAALRKLTAKQALRGLVLDLRSNPGGLLGAAVGVSDLFLESGRIVETKGRQATANLSFDARKGDLLKGAPIVVLIDAGTASASEIVAGALQDHQRALIVGQASFGKGSVQSILPLDNGDGIKLTTARYYTPNGRSIQAAGINPDVPLAAGEFARSSGTLRPVSEADLPGHLAAAEQDAVEASSASSDLTKDYAVYEAVNILRAIAALKTNPARH